MVYCGVILGVIDEFKVKVWFKVIRVSVVLGVGVRFIVGGRDCGGII